MRSMVRAVVNVAAMGVEHKQYIHALRRVCHHNHCISFCSICLRVSEHKPPQGDVSRALVRLSYFWLVFFPASKPPCAAQEAKCGLPNQVAKRSHATPTQQCCSEGAQHALFLLGRDCAVDRQGERCAPTFKFLIKLLINVKLY